MTNKQRPSAEGIIYGIVANRMAEKISFSAPMITQIIIGEW